MKRIIPLMMVLCLLLSGCSFWNDGSYASVEPHTEPSNQQEKTVITVSDYAQLQSALATMVESGAENGILAMEYAEDEQLKAHVEKAIQALCKNNPFAAYAVENIDYTIGQSGGQKAASIQITYLQNRVRSDKIQRVETLAQVEQLVTQSLDNCDAGVVLYFENPEQVDYVQLVSDYALMYPQRVMETPEVTVSLYPEEGQTQIVELKFSYQTSRGELRALQNKVAPVFASAAQIVAGDWSPEEKVERLYAFLMGRYEYHIQTSITPAYSLLLHGVGDSRAFAMVYAAMCSQAQVECKVVTGTREGVTWVWNAIQIDGVYYYMDLLRCREGEGFALHTQEDMVDYVWDYSAYPIAQEIS